MSKDETTSQQNHATKWRRVGFSVAVIVGLGLMAVFGATYDASGAPRAQQTSTPTSAESPSPTAAVQARPYPVGLGYHGLFGFGRAATEEEIAAWDIDVMPDGTGLPEGEGSVADGGELYQESCAACHGPDGTSDAWHVLVNPYVVDEPWPQTPRSIGNYWPYATTVYDYVNRAMPYNEPNSLTADEVYALTAWLLYQNDILAGDEVLDETNLAQIEMPAHEHFVQGDPRDNYRHAGFLYGDLPTPTPAE